MSSDALTRSCPVCGGARAAPYLEKHGMQLVQCASCGMVYANPVAKAYGSGEYYEREASNYYLSPAKLGSDYSPVRFRRELKLFRAHCAKGRVLDVGCGSGAFLFQLRRRHPQDYEIKGTDVSGPPLDHAESRGIPVLRADFLTHDFRSEQFDALTFWAVLEHLFAPQAFLAKAASILKPGGLCFVLVPNLNSLAVRLIGKRYRYVYAQHLNYFTAATLSRLAPAEFSVQTVTYTHFNPIVLWQDWKSGGAEVSNSERGELLKHTTAMKQNPLLAPIQLCYRLSEKFLARFGMTDNVAVVLKKLLPA